MSSADRESAGWEDRLSTVVCMVREQQTRVPHCRLSSSIWPIMPPQNIGLNGAFDDCASTTCCDAVISYYTRNHVREAIKPRINRQRGLDLASEPIDFWLFLIACFVGDLARLAASYENLQRLEVYGPPTQSDLSFKMSTCLHVAAQEGHEEVVKYLIDNGAELEANVMVDPIGASALEGSLLAAAETGQMNILRLLLPLCTKSEAPRIKGRMLWIACKYNNVSVAQYVLDTGSVQAYDLQEYYLEHPQHVFGNPLSVAYSNGQAGCVRLLLRSQHRFCQASAARKASFIKGLVAPTNRTKRFNVFTAVIPFLNARQVLLEAAAVDGGIELVMSKKGLCDLNGKYRRVSQEDELTLGAQALRQSVQCGNLSNIRILLARGVRISNTVAICPNGAPKLPERIKKLFTAASHKGVLSMCRRYLIVCGMPDLADGGKLYV